MEDLINSPKHYTQGPIDCIDAIQAALGPEGFVAYCRGTAIKYAWRAGLKDDAAQDLEKGAWYATRGAGVAEQATEEAEQAAATAEYQRNLETEISHLRSKLEEENRQWLAAQDGLRAEWLQIVEALGAIVPVIEGESTLSMVGRVQSLVSGLRMYEHLYNAAACGSVFDSLGKRLALALQGLRDIAERDSGSLAIGQWMAIHAKETIEKVEAYRG